MKTYLRITALFLAFASLATAAIKLPHKAFAITELAKAKEQAAERGKPIAFVDT